MIFKDADPVLYDPKTGHLQDFIQGETMLFSKRPLADVLAEMPNLERVTFAKAVELSEAFARKRYCTGATQITEERFWEMLEVLPPCRWDTTSVGGRRLEMFHVSERLTGNLVSWFVADHSTPEVEYWELTECGAATREHIGQIVATAREAIP